MAGVFAHSGAYGDLIAHLPVVRGLGGGRLVLYPHPRTLDNMTPARAAGIAPLLERQPYVTAAVWAPGPEGLDLDAWRAAGIRRGENLTAAACRCFRVSYPPPREPWLTGVDPVRAAAVVFARSPRYHNPDFPWRRAWQAYHRRAVFVGLPDEHAAFEAEVGPVPYHPTPDMLALARVVAGASLFVGNQSSPLVVAEGLKVRAVVVEVCRWADNARWHRPGVTHGLDRRVRLPTLPVPRPPGLRHPGLPRGVGP